MSSAVLSEPFSITVVAAMALAFGGFSVLAALKDQKDIEVDLETRSQTVYTVVARRGGEVLVAHRWLVGVSMVCMASCLPLLALAGRVTWGWAIPGLMVALALPWVDREPSRPGFYRFAALVSLLLLLVLVALAFSTHS